MGGDCTSTVRPFFPSETAYLPLLGECGLYIWLLYSANIFPFVGLFFCCLTQCFVGGENSNDSKWFYFSFTSQTSLITEFYLCSHHQVKYYNVYCQALNSFYLHYNDPRASP